MQTQTQMETKTLKCGRVAVLPVRDAGLWAVKSRCELWV